eukprot:c8975_g1_i1.p2 GENE.c8975_g1_i1~~c8975_g1_i1.p2  ORF type:complete len:106 (+),score=31.02 c8975_g1_i1:133-450(+)
MWNMPFFFMPPPRQQLIGMGSRPAAPVQLGGDGMSINDIFASQLVMSMLAGEGARSSIMFPSILTQLMMGTLTELSQDLPNSPLALFDMLYRGGSLSQAESLMPK